MGLSKREFAVLLAIHDGKASSQRDLAAQAGVSLGTVNNVMKKLREESLAQCDGGGSPFRPLVKRR